jgi:hypothetical protein
LMTSCCTTRMHCKCLQHSHAGKQNVIMHKVYYKIYYQLLIYQSGTIYKCTPYKCTASALPRSCNLFRSIAKDASRFRSRVANLKFPNEWKGASSGRHLVT